METNITNISGPISLYIHHYDNKKYFFFGDAHFSITNNCTDLGFNCDYLNRDANCIMIVDLLHIWFLYNSKYDIKTDFYLEIPFTKIDKREIFPDIDYLRKIRNFFSTCFFTNKNKCPYPNIHGHYMDNRRYGTIQKYTFPFRMVLVETVLKIFYEGKYEGKYDLHMIYYDVVLWIRFLLSNILVLMRYLLSPYGLEDYYNLLNSVLDKNFKTDFVKTLLTYLSPTNDYTNIDFFTVNRTIDGKNIKMFKTAWELYKLKLTNKFIYEKLQSYINDRLNNLVSNIETYYDYTNYYIKYFNRKITPDDQTFTTMIDNFDLFFETLEGNMPDFYYLSRLFTQTESEEIVTYTGDFHTINYNQFFKKYLNNIPLLEINSDYINMQIGDIKRCPSVDNLNDFIPVNLYKDSLNDNYYS